MSSKWKTKGQAEMHVLCGPESISPIVRRQTGLHAGPPCQLLLWPRHRVADSTEEVFCSLLYKITTNILSKCSQF